MPRGLRKDVKSHLEKARESALLAVEVYNKPATTFKSGAYITLMVIAWTALFHAIFFKDRIKPYYKEGRRYKRIDGDYAAWNLSDCLRNYYKEENPPERKNLEFFVPLRNKIEHRNMPALDEQIFGECQAMLFNFEDMIFQEFGSRYAISESLAISLQFSRSLNDDQLDAIRRQRGTVSPDVDAYVKRYRSSLGLELSGDSKFSYKVFLIPKIANNAGQADIAVEFVKYDADNPKEMEEYNQLAAFIKTKNIPVANLDNLMPSEVCVAVEPIVQECVGQDKRFSASYHHARAYKFYEIRPEKGALNPGATKAEYCIYDEAHNDYVYTPAWRDFLVEEMKKPGRYEQVMG